MTSRSTEHSRATIVVVQTTVPDYRKPFFEALTTTVRPSQLVLLSGDEDWQRDIAHAHDVPHQRVRNVFFARRQLLLQWGAVWPLLGADIAVVGLNPRVVTSWIALVGRRLLGRPTVVWGHAWPRKGPSRSTDRVRGVMRRMASTLVVYTEAEAEQVARMTPRIDVVAAPNALYSRDVLSPGALSGSATDVLYVGRLTPSKRPELLLDGFSDAVPSLPPDVRLVVVGDGPLRPTLEAHARARGVAERVLFMGHISDAQQLRDLYARAIASVSPGPVGLALIQSLGFGVPMMLGNDDEHGTRDRSRRRRRERRDVHIPLVERARSSHSFDGS